MIWQSAAEFWAMGGYGVYVWGSMGVSAGLLALEVWLARLGRQQALDAVCEALDAKALDVEAPSPVQASSVGAARLIDLDSGAAA